jgi:hypothetical protein
LRLLRRLRCHVDINMRAGAALNKGESDCPTSLGKWQRAKLEV